MESWRKVFRDGLAPILSDNALAALAAGLRADDKTLIQGATTTPPPLSCCQDWDVEAACPIGYAYWRGDGLNLIGEVEEAFARTCFAIDESIGEPSGCRFLLNWMDETPRCVMFTCLLEEVEREITRRDLLAHSMEVHDAY